MEAPTDAGSIQRARRFVADRRGVAPEHVEFDAVLLAAALAESHRLGINPGGEVQVIGPLVRGAVEQVVPVADRNRLLSREEIQAHG